MASNEPMDLTVRNFRDENEPLDLSIRNLNTSAQSTPNNRSSSQVNQLGRQGTQPLPNEPLDLSTKTRKRAPASATSGTPASGAEVSYNFLFYLSVSALLHT